MRRTAIVADRRYMDHIAGRHHPERPERIAAMIEMTEHLTRPALKHHSPRAASIAELELCHSDEYVRQIRQTAEFDRFAFDPDTHTSRATWETARLAVGGVLTAVEAVADGDSDNAFAIVRPPGHHARPDHAMGFCFFNNVAIAARWLLAHSNLHRVLVVDWDVHHGNGTQEIFYDSPEVLYISLHQYPFYPGTGWFDEVGADGGLGFTVNAPLPASFGDAEYLQVLDEVVIPIARQFKPEFVLISAGFDCHFRDPLGGMRVSEAGFTAMARRLKRVAAESCAGKLVAVLEGGYDLQALATGGRTVIDEFGRDADEPLETASGNVRVIPIIERMQHFLSPYWNL